MFIDKFVVTDGVLKGKVLSFADTTDWKNPAYVEISEEGSGKGSEEGSGKGSGNAPSNKKLKTEKEEVRQKKSGFQHAQDGQEPVDSRHVDKHQEQPQELQASLDQLSAQEQHQEQAPVQPPVGSYDFQDLAPIKKPYRSWEQLRQLWWDFRYEVEDLKIPGGNVASWGQPDGTDFRDFLNETDDSLEDIMNVARWGAVKSKHWFKPGKGQIDGFTGFRNAYAAMAKQHQNYKIKSQGATV